MHRTSGRGVVDTTSSSMDQQAFSTKGQIINISGSMGQMVSVANIQFRRYSVPAVTGHM